MHTEVVKVNPSDFSKIEIKKAVNLIKSGKIIGFPTETVYGLGCSIYSEEAIPKIFKVKGRPMDNPLIVHISDMDMLKDLVLDIPNSVLNLCKKYWPGPLTILFKKSKKVPDIVTAGLKTVAIRMPSNLVARTLIKEANVPIAAPSANTSGKPSPTTAQHVYHDLKGKIPLIIDSGPCDFGMESTVLDFHQEPPCILRPGGLSFEDLQKFIPSIQIYERTENNLNLKNQPSSPGLKYKHYSPKAPIILIEGPSKQIEKKVIELCKNLINKYNLISIFHTHNSIKYPKFIKDKPNFIIHSLGLKKNEETQHLLEYNSLIIAKGLFASLRKLDDLNVDLIIVEGISEENEGLPVMNRLRKAAEKIIKL